MDLQVLVKQYLSVTKMYAYIVGVWPFMSQTQKIIRRIYIISVAVSAIITQVAKVVVFFSIQGLIDQIPFLMVAIAAMVKYSNYTLNDSKFKDLFNSMVKDWQAKKTQEEERLMQKYANRSVFFISIYILNAYFCTSVFFFLPLMPRLMDILIPLNESRPRIQMYPAYYFLDNDDDYYYVIMAYTIVTLLVAMSIFIASDTILVYVVQHICGLLSLAGYRFKRCLDDLHSLTDNCKIDHAKMYKKVCYAINTHQRALEFLNEIENAYVINLFIQVGVVVLSFTITLLKVASITWSMDTYPYYGYVIAQFVHIFFLTVQGQFVIDLHDSIYIKGYENYWYNGDIKTQALFILIQRRNLTPPLLTAGGLIQLNLDSFAEVKFFLLTVFY
ncbi:uncharacterized protein LOC143422361 [Xylocopa sonorina]|uniref:uncharacterized protein LOC143422361 n=1 Tax=Xylocopa sonorina TaxID=1818115 RepID=UPI00403B2C6D